MNSNRMRLAAGTLSAIVLAAPLLLAAAPSLVITNLTGRMHIVQDVPCGGVVDATTSIADGRMEITPIVRGTAIGGPVQFNLTRFDVFFTPFSVRHECSGIGAAVEFTEIGARLASAVTFTGEQVPGTEGLLYRFSIPKEQFRTFFSMTDNEPVQQPQTGYKWPSEDVTGVIDLQGRTAQLHIVFASRLRFRAGCVGERCIIDEERAGTHTADIAGVIVAPDTDSDSDGVPDLDDNCPLVINRSQSPVTTPVISAPPDVTLSSCQAPNIGTARASDVCHGRPVAIANDAPAQFAIGPNLVTWTGNDGIDPIVAAQQTVTIVGDTNAPVLSCRAADPPGSKFRVVSSDDCGGPISLTLGAFALVNNELIQIQESGKPGVRLLGTVGPDKIRHFQVGKGEALVLATDAAGNTARVACK